jgi:hypothetical protein
MIYTFWDVCLPWPLPYIIMGALEFYGPFFILFRLFMRIYKLVGKKTVVSHMEYPVCSVPGFDKAPAYRAGDLYYKGARTRMCYRAG